MLSIVFCPGLEEEYVEDIQTRSLIQKGQHKKIKSG